MKYLYLSRKIFADTFLNIQIGRKGDGFPKNRSIFYYALICLILKMLKFVVYIVCTYIHFGRWFVFMRNTTDVPSSYLK